ncbi:EAL domain-containing protein [Blastococcus sp. DSM 46792]|uniref:EAL domain-containing protein n=1 Tax=Blastococcus goldschmidtiae TaxID=3075546 RepID=A0ABU2K8V8_9ACTN|nr:EAL domain-containing protein [Blastococcus sp. DSM 46792]MDT0276634.1 EAL domain-containing protein [Blastococcus sp. DSM 46792]
MDLVMIAEGVETPAQARILTALGCPLGQGYLYGRPRPVAELVAELGSVRTTVESSLFRYAPTMFLPIRTTGPSDTWRPGTNSALRHIAVRSRSSTGMETLRV